MSALETDRERRAREFLDEAYRVWSAASYLGSVSDNLLVRLVCRAVQRRYARRIETLIAMSKGLGR